MSNKVTQNLYFTKHTCSSVDPKFLLKITMETYKLNFPREIKGQLPKKSFESLLSTFLVMWLYFSMFYVKLTRGWKGVGFAADFEATWKINRLYSNIQVLYKTPESSFSLR